MQLQLSPAHPDFGKVGFTELEERVRNRAYQLFEKRGFAHGHALDDWLEAKAQVLGVTKGDTYLETSAEALKWVPSPSLLETPGTCAGS
jgi:hypothetical protein